MIHQELRAHRSSSFAEARDTFRRYNSFVAMAKQVAVLVAAANSYRVARIYGSRRKRDVPHCAVNVQIGRGI
jgi:hypothetical protein